MNTQPTRALRRALIIQGLAERVLDDLPPNWDSTWCAAGAVRRNALELADLLRRDLKEPRR